ncbi:MAG: methylenetetrahydrofolate reductase C-terminal domain-containing protein, partial [Bacteroidetes bacterium]|nr:methylenetetrahydrofolate reductase C-terminal domain-containing protein [Bacteroidota bacterium]
SNPPLTPSVTIEPTATFWPTVTRQVLPEAESAGLLPCQNRVVSDDLLARIDKEKQAEDKGKKFFIDYAAKQYAAFKGMGYSGAYLGGVAKYDDFAEILEKAEEYKSHDWRDFVPELTSPLKNEFYFYSLNKENQLSDAENKNSRLVDYKKSFYSKHVSFGYRFSRLVHSLAFGYKAPLFKPLKFRFKILEGKGFRGWRNFCYFHERMTKAAIFSCKDCGDCSLPDITYLCPESQCAKNQRNGPCGGSFLDKCEVTKNGKYCIWVKAYSRNKYFNKDKECLLQRPVVIKNNELQDTSGWANCFLLRDHNAYKTKE